MEANEAHFAVQVEQKKVSTFEENSQKQTSIDKQINESDIDIAISDNIKHPNHEIVEDNNILNMREEPKSLTYGKSDVTSIDINTSPDKSDALSNNESTASNNLSRDPKVKDKIDLRHPILSSIAEGEISVNKHASLPVSSQKIDVTCSGGRRLTEPVIKPVKTDKNRLKSLDCKNMEITRVVSSERHSNRSGFGGTADFDGKKPSATPSDRLKAELSITRSHPLIILPDDGKFWCDPPREKVTETKYSLSCFEMQSKDKYKDMTNVVENPSEVAAEAYIKSFSKVPYP